MIHIPCNLAALPPACHWKNRFIVLIGTLRAACVVTIILTTTSGSAGTVDLPTCEVTAPGMAEGLSLGIVQPYDLGNVVDYAVKLTLVDANLSICAESWSSIVPLWVPWSQALERGHGFALFAFAFVLMVVVLWHITPRQWWRHTTLLGVLAVGLGTWLLGVGLMAGFHGLGGQRMLYQTVVSLRTPQQAVPQWINVAGARELEAVLAQAGLLTTLTPTAGVTQQVGARSTSLPSRPPPAAGQGGVTSNLQPSGPYRVAHQLNLREGPGTQHAHLRTLSRAEVVQFDGALQGDWWRVRTASGQVGWSSSLWLRRPGESLPIGASASGGEPRS